MKTTIDNCGNIYENPVGDMMYKIATQFRESQENFIFETIKPWCEETTQFKISKQELVRALTFYRMKDAMVDDIKHSNFHGIARPGYMDGYSDGLRTALKIINQYHKGE